MNEFGLKLNELLKESQMSRNDLAKKLNITPTSLTRYIKGHREPDFQTLCILTKIFNVTTDYLLGLEDEAGISIINTNLTDEEQRLLDYYRALPPELRSGVMTYTQTFYEMDKQSKRGYN